MKAEPVMNAFQLASLVNAPVDRNLGNGMGLVQVGVVDPRYHGNNAGQCNGGQCNAGQYKRMSGQWGGAYLAEKETKVSEDEESDDE